MCGLDDAILCARAFVQDEPFAVLLGDDVVYNGEGRPALKQLIDVYNETGSSILGCQTVPEEKVLSYGIIKGEPTSDARTMRVLDMVEKPAVEDAPSRMAVLGRYIITPAIFDILAHTLPGKGGEVQLTDALSPTGSRSTPTTSKARATTSAISSASSRPRSSSPCVERTWARLSGRT